jgi:HPt (histidine-containing phosphotransfer) domain-containing protein
MKEAYVQDDTERVADLAHKLLPPARHIGASDLSNVLRKIEVDIRNSNDLRDLESDINISATEFALVRDLVNEQISYFS